MTSKTTTLSKGLLLGCGNPLLDISANVNNEFLKKYDMKADDAILAAEKHMTIYQELIDEYKADFLAGGSVQNSLRVAQWILQEPNIAVFFGCVGKDDYAKILAEKAHSAGVDVHYQVTEEEPTGTCAVLITGTHRSLCANLAAANKFTPEHIKQPENKKLIEQAQYYYISGFFLTVSPPSIMEVARYAHAQDRPFIMNLSAPFISQFFKEPLLAALPYVDILFGNEMEAKAFASEQGWPTDNMEAIGLKLLDVPKVNTNRPRIIVITQGQLPVLLIQRSGILEFPVKKLEPKQIVDTNGAGDAFVGGFLAQYVLQKSLDVCVRCGIWAASQIIQSNGCTFKGTPNFQA